MIINKTNNVMKAFSRSYQQKVVSSIAMCIIIAVFGLFSISAQSQNKTKTIFVSPTGNDTNSGVYANEPFATLEKAKNEARKYKDSHVEIHLKGGTYLLSETLHLTMEDSRENSTLTFKAFQNETPVLSSGTVVKSWKKASKLPKGMSKLLKGKVWEAPIPEGVNDFKVMFRNGVKLRRARGEGFDPIPHKKGEAFSDGVDLISDKNAGKSDKQIAEWQKQNFYYPEGMIRNWPNLNDIELIIRPSAHWLLNILTLAKVDEQKRIATTHVKATYKLNPVRNKPSMWVENAPECLTKPGEWIVNTKKRKIYYYPQDGKNPESSITVPALKVLVKVEGDVDFQGPIDKPVKGIVFDGISFTQGDRGSWYEGQTGMQHDWEMLDADDALLRFRGVEDCQVLNCNFYHSGASAMRFDLHAQRNLVKGNTVHDMGGTAITFIGYGPGTKDVNKHNTICNNHLYNIGQIWWHSQTIILWQSGNNKIFNNLIHDVPRKAICMSGVRLWFFDKNDARYRNEWRECGQTIRWHEISGDVTTWEGVVPYLHTRDNIVENNEAYHCLMRLGDGGVMNISGAGRGNIIRRNYVHDIHTKEWTDGVIRTDDYQEGSIIEENIVWKCDQSALVLKGDNIARNNYFIDAGQQENAVVRICLDNKNAQVSHNVIIHGNKAPEREAHYSKYKWETLLYAPIAAPDATSSACPKVETLKDCTLDYNLMYNAYYEGMSPELTKYREAGHEQHSIFTNPLFKDLENGDFTPTANSPIYKLGIKPLLIEEVGLQKDFPREFSEKAKSYKHVVF